MGKTDPAAETHKQQSMILVPLDAPGVTIKRHLPVFGYDDAPHGHMEIALDDVRVPPSNMLLGEGWGSIRRGAGRADPPLHADDRRGRGSARGDGEAADVAHRVRQDARRTGRVGRRVANTRIDMDDAAALPPGRGHEDRAGNKAAQGEIAMIKVAAPIMALKIIDDAIQAFGAAGVSEDAGLARSYASIRTLRLADGPDEVHRRAIARLEYKKHR